jgi:hypothetical protein
MSPFERQRMLSVLVMLVMALFVGGGFVPAGCPRRLVRVAAITLFTLVAIAALVEAALWLAQG